MALHRPVCGEGQPNLHAPATRASRRSHGDPSAAARRLLAFHRQIVHKDAEPPCATLLRAGAVPAAGPCALTTSADLSRRLAVPTASGDPLTAASGCLLTASADPLQLAAAVRAIDSKRAPVAEADADGATAAASAAERVRVVGSTPPAAAPGELRWVGERVLAYYGRSDTAAAKERTVPEDPAQRIYEGLPPESRPPSDSARGGTSRTTSCRAAAGYSRTAGGLRAPQLGRKSAFPLWVF